MPELPEVAASTKYFEKCALGLRIASAKVKDPRIVRGLTAGELEKELTGRTFISTRQHGKYFFAQTDGGTRLIAHFGMNGYLRFKRIFSGKKGEIKPALMNQKLVAGIGNIYADEILFQARIHPKMKIAGLCERQLESLFNGSKGVLRTAVDSNGDIGGTSYFCPCCQKINPSPGR